MGWFFWFPSCNAKEVQNRVFTQQLQKSSRVPNQIAVCENIAMITNVHPLCYISAAMKCTLPAAAELIMARTSNQGFVRPFKKGVVSTLGHQTN